MAIGPAPGRQLVRYGGHRSQFVEVWTPGNTPAPGAVLLLHGGWWRDRHDLRLMDELVADLVRRGHLVWNLEYRRIDGDAEDRGGGGWPATLEDVLSALAVLCSGSSGVEAGSVVAVGHSAGGQLSLLAARAVGLAGVVALAPITDLTSCAEAGLGEGATAVFVGGGSGTRQAELYREASPIDQLPIGCPQLLVHGTCDDRVPLDHSRAYLDSSNGAGDVTELREIVGGDHMFVLDPHHGYWPGVVRWMTALTASRATG